MRFRSFLVTACFAFSACGGSAPAGSGLAQMPPRVHRSPLSLTILSLLVERPLHPYAMQTRIKAWRKDAIVNVSQRSNLYKTIERLRSGGLIAVAKTERDRRFPERAVYKLTAAGRRQALEWLDEMISVPRNEYPEFPAALSFIFFLSPELAIAALERRAAALREKLASLDRELKSEGGPPRLFLLETDYLRAVTAAELKWVRGIIDDLRAGRLHWTREQFAAEYTQLRQRSLSREAG